MKYWDDKGVNPVCECLGCGAAIPSFDAWWSDDCGHTDHGHDISWTPYPWVVEDDDKEMEMPCDSGHCFV